MPEKIHSRKQWAALFAKADRGEIPLGTVKEMAVGVDYKSLPSRVKGGGSRDRETARSIQNKRRAKRSS